MTDDARIMAAALSLARRSLGRTWPNPAVGCILLGDGEARRVVGRGWTGPGGRPHAETVALAQAGAAARGATAYVTLEPCSHHGRTPPCADALVAAGVARVVAALEDPDPRVSGAGFARLRAAGVEVTTGVLEAAAREVNAGFISRVTRGRPHVTLKLAVSADGMIAAAPGIPTPITSEAARDRAHMMRALTDAILVGAGTWRADDPALTCRLPGLADRSPVRVALDARAELPASSRLAATATTTPLWLLVSSEAPAGRRAVLASRGAELIDCPVDAAGRLDLAAGLALLGDRGITRLLVEGGAAVAASLLAADLVDDAAIFTAPAKLGPGGVGAPRPIGPDGIAGETRFVLVSTDRLGPDTLRIYRHG